MKPLIISVCDNYMSYMQITKADNKGFSTYSGVVKPIEADVDMLVCMSHIELWPWIKRMRIDLRSTNLCLELCF